MPGRNRYEGWALALPILLAACAPDRVDLGAKDGVSANGLSATRLQALDAASTPLCPAGEAAMDFATQDQAFAYSLVLGAGDSVRLRTTGDAVDTVLYLHGPATGDTGIVAPPLAWDDDGGEGRRSLIASAVAPSAGRFLVVVTTAGGAGKGHVVLDVQVDGTPGCGGGIPDGGDVPDAADALDAGDTPEAVNAGEEGTTPARPPSVLPGEVKFGLVALGCCAREAKICAYNPDGNAIVQLEEVHLQGCTPEVYLKNVPALPVAIHTGEPVCFNVGFYPATQDEVTCSIEVVSTDPGVEPVSVEVNGRGVVESQQEDEFRQVSGPRLDVLLVIDDSGSMCDEQETLIRSFQALIDTSSLWKSDFHVGVIDNNVLNPQVAGRLNGGDASLPYRWVSNATPDPKAAFAAMANLGCTGCPHGLECPALQTTDKQEAGLQAVQMALSAPLIQGTGVACSKDADCWNDRNICAESTGCPFGCIDGTCGGWNRGFLRSDAQLEIIVLSDEDDQSPETTGFYVDFLKNIKGYYNASLMNLSAIVGPAGGCDDGPDGTVPEALRYIDVATATGGRIGSICADDYGSLLEPIGQACFSPKVQFFLTRPALASSVTVVVGGVECATGWRYDFPSNSVIFDRDGPCMPGDDQPVTVRYDVLCDCGCDCG